MQECHNLPCSNGGQEVQEEVAVSNSSTSFGSGEPPITRNLEDEIATTQVAIFFGWGPSSHSVEPVAREKDMPSYPLKRHRDSCRQEVGRVSMPLQWI